jgi:hypothetical protein
LRRRLLNLLTILSLVLFVAAAALWVTSQFRYEAWYTIRRDAATGITSMVEVDSGGGAIFAQYNYQWQAAMSEDNTGWQHRLRSGPQPWLEVRGL